MPVYYHEPKESPKSDNGPPRWFVALFFAIAFPVLLACAMITVLGLWKAYVALNIAAAQLWAVHPYVMAAFLASSFAGAVYGYVGLGYLKKQYAGEYLPK